MKLIAASYSQREKVKTINFDNGKVFARHERKANELKLKPILPIGITRGKDTSVNTRMA